AGRVSGKPDPGQETLSIVSLPGALHCGPKCGERWRLKGPLQGRQESADWLPSQRLCSRRQQALSRVVAEKNLSIRINDDDSRRTALDQNMQLLFRFLPPLHLVSQFVSVASECEIAVANKLRNKQPRAHETSGAKYKVYELLILGQIAEIKNSA